MTYNDSYFGKDYVSLLPHENDKWVELKWSIAMSWTATEYYASLSLDLLHCNITIMSQKVELMFE